MHYVPRNRGVIKLPGAANIPLREVSDYVPIYTMPRVVKILEVQLTFEIKLYAKTGIQAVITFGISHHLDDVGSNT